MIIEERYHKRDCMDLRWRVDAITQRIEGWDLTNAFNFEDLYDQKKNIKRKRGKNYTNVLFERGIKHKTTFNDEAVENFYKLINSDDSD